MAETRSRTQGAHEEAVTALARAQSTQGRQGKEEGWEG